MISVAALVGFLGIWLLLWLPLAFIVARRLKMAWTYPVAPAHKLPLLLPLYGLAPLAIWGYSRFLAPQSWSDYGLIWRPSLWFAMGTGFAIAVLGVLLLVLMEWGLGWRRLSFPGQGESSGSMLLPVAGVLVLTVFIGGIEELVFRGVLVQGLLPVMPLGAVVVATSLIFALSHLVWDGTAGIPSLLGLGLMGGVLFLARWVDGGGLGLPWGLHSGWIFAIALLDTLNLASQVNEPLPPLAGKPDQPLTGIFPLGLLVLTGVGLWVYYQGL